MSAAIRFCALFAIAAAQDVFPVPPFAGCVRKFGDGSLVEAEATTVAPAARKLSVGSTTNAPGTDGPVATTALPDDDTATEAPVAATTTEAPVTTESPDASTEAPERTEAPVEVTTTVMPEEDVATHAPVGSTTVAPVATTTEAPVEESDDDETTTTTTTTTTPFVVLPECATHAEFEVEWFWHCPESETEWVCPTAADFTTTPVPEGMVEKEVQVVSSALSFTGLTEAAARAIEPAIVSSLAARLGVSDDAVEITGYTESRRTRKLRQQRRLEGTSVEVEFEVAVPEGADATAVAASVVEVGGSSDLSAGIADKVTELGLEAALVEAGGDLTTVATAAVTVVSAPVIETKTVLVAATTAAPSTPSVTEEPAEEEGSSKAGWIVFAVVMAALVVGGVVYKNKVREVGQSLLQYVQKPGFLPVMSKPAAAQDSDMSTAVPEVTVDLEMAPVEVVQEEAPVEAPVEASISHSTIKMTL